MKRININDWRYKLMVAMFGMAEKDLPKNSCQFHVYTILSLLIAPIVYFTEFLTALSVNDWEDFNTILKPTKDDETYYRFTKPIFYTLGLVCCVFFSAIMMFLIYGLIITTFHLPNVLFVNGVTPLSILLATILSPVNAFIIQMIVRLCNKCKEFCKPIEYTGRYEYYEDEDFNMYVKNPVLSDKSKFYYEGAGPNWDEDDNDKRFFKMFISSELKHNKEDWMKAGLKEGTILTDEVFEAATKKAFNR